MSAIYEVLRQLDEWRHLPAYQLERRVDIFFGMFLPKVIEKRFGVRVDDVIPEFPLHKGKLGISEDNRSINVDYVVFGSEGHIRRIFLVELKTDINSLDEKQLKRMMEARRIGDLLEGVGEAAQNSKSKPKYAHLIWRLLKLGCLRFSENEVAKEVRNIRWDSPKLSPFFEDLTADTPWRNADVDFVVILPTEPEKSKQSQVPDGFEVITFTQIADILVSRNEPFGSGVASVFSGFLRQWAAVNAGTVAPSYPYR